MLRVVGPVVLACGGCVAGIGGVATVQRQTTAATATTPMTRSSAAETGVYLDAVVPVSKVGLMFGIAYGAGRTGPALPSESELDFGFFTWVSAGVGVPRDFDQLRLMPYVYKTFGVGTTGSTLGAGLEIALHGGSIDKPSGAGFALRIAGFSGAGPGALVSIGGRFDAGRVIGVRR